MRTIHAVNALFFFQAEDGIRDFHVTGVQTCALPISRDQREQPLGCFNAMNACRIHPLHERTNCRPLLRFGREQEILRLHARLLRFQDEPGTLRNEESTLSPLSLTVEGAYLSDEWIGGRAYLLDHEVSLIGGALPPFRSVPTRRR